MRRIVLGLAAVFMTAGVGFAAEPAKMADTAKGKA